MTTNSAEYWEGFHAYRKGTVMNCPYAPGSQQAKDWGDGWFAASFN